MPSHLVLALGVIAATTIAIFLLYLTVSDFLRTPPAPDPADTPDTAESSETQLDTNVGPGSKYASEHPDLLVGVKALIAARGYKCPMIVDLWSEKNSAGETRLEALCGPDASHAETTLHYAVYADRGKVDLCQPWKEFGPDCL